MASETSLCLSTLNVRGLAAKRKQSQVYRLMTDQDLDVLAIQETKIAGEADTASMVQRFTSRYYAVVSHANGASAGCVLFVKKLSGLVMQETVSSPTGRLVVCDFLLCDKEWRILCLYAPNEVDARENFFANVKQYLSTQKRVVLMGDFNCVLNGRDKTSRSAFRDKSTDLLTDLIKEYDLDDVAECLQTAHGVEYTHFQGTSHARLDRIYVSLDMVPKCNNYHVVPMSFSDHCLVKCLIGTKKHSCSFNWDLWKINAKLISDKTFIDTVKNKISEINFAYASNMGEQWEWCKQNIKMKALERSSCIRYEERRNESALRTMLKRLIELESRTPGAFKDDVRKIKQKLQVIDEEKYRGAVVRARAEALTAGEVPTKRALRLEKTYASRNQIHEIEWNGNLVMDNFSIADVFFQHYQALFSLRKVDVPKFKNAFLGVMPQLDDELKERLEQPISKEEVYRAIDNLNNGKSPGPDGLSAAFYKAFKQEITPVLAAVFNEAYELNVLPPSYRTSHTVLIPKTDQTEKLRLPTSYRPISLTNVDYKIFMKILAARLQTVMPEIVGDHQTCGIKGRSILNNIHKARCVLECCDVMQVCVAVLQIDLEKAFDCVSHDILLAILEYINVGTVIRQGVAMAYQNCSTQLIVNKTIGKSISVQRSVRQGCPLSPLLFCVYIETLCRSILQNDAIQGFRLHASEVKLLAYADDVALFCENKESVIEAVRVVKQFSDISGSPVNWGKCLGFWHGEWPSTPATFANIRWETTPVKYLGVPLEFYKDNDRYWQQQVKEMREKVDRWKVANLSIFSRATVCNLFFISKIWYTMQVLYCSRLNIQKFHRIFAVFVWASSWERCSRTNLFRRVKDGGVGLGHLFVRQLVNRFIFFRDVRDPFLRTVCQMRISKALPDFIVATSSIPGTLKGFFKEVVSTVRFLSVRFSKDYLSSVQRKKLYRDLCDTEFPVPLYRSLYRGSQGQNVLKRVKRMQIPPGVKTFFFKVHTGTLSVKTVLKEKGFFVPWGTHCLICNQPETIDHVFLHCWEGVFLWDVLQRTVKKEFPLDPYGIRYLAIENDDGLPFDLVMLVGLHSIWRARMAGYYCDPDARPARMYFRESINAFLEVQKAHECAPEWLSRLEPLATLREF